MPATVACAIVHDDPPEVFIAEDIETLNWILALKLIAQCPGREVPEPIRTALRSAVLDEQWGRAVGLWMEFRPGAIDVYPSYELYRPEDVALGPEELQFSRLFLD